MAEDKLITEWRYIRIGATSEFSQRLISCICTWLLKSVRRSPAPAALGPIPSQRARNRCRAVGLKLNERTIKFAHYLGASSAAELAALALCHCHTSVSTHALTSISPRSLESSLFLTKFLPASVTVDSDVPSPSSFGVGLRFGSFVTQRSTKADRSLGKPTGRLVLRTEVV